MADEVTTEAVVEESAPVEAPSEPVVTDPVEETQPAAIDEPTAEPTPEPNATDEPAQEVVEAQTTPELDLSGLTVSKLREINPELAQQLEYAGEQRRESQLRREAGERQNVRDRVRAIKAKLAETAADDDAGLDVVWQDAAMNGAHEQLQAMTKSWTEQYQATPEEAEALNEAAAAGNVQAYAGRLLGFAARQIGQQAVYDMDISEIPPDSKLAQSVQALRTQSAQSEERAAEIEAQPARSAPPAVSQGNPVGTTETHDLNSVIGIARARRAGQITEAEGSKLIAQAKRQTA